MSTERVAAFLSQVEGNAAPGGLPDDPSPADVVAQARALGFEFTEVDLGSVLKQRLFTAQSLPRGWGWPVARKLGLVRS